LPTMLPHRASRRLGAALASAVVSLIALPPISLPCPQTEALPDYPARTGTLRSSPKEHRATLWQFVNPMVWKYARGKLANLSKLHFCRWHPGSGGFEATV
jgi:hypothetical protein